MSIQAIEAVKRSTLAGATRLVAYELATYADRVGGSIFPSVTTVAQSLGVGRRTVQRHLTILLDCRVLETAGKSRKGVNRYRFSQSFMNTSNVDHGDAQTVVDHSGTSGGSFLHRESAEMIHVVDHGGTSLVDHDDTQTLLTPKLTPQLITANEHAQKLNKSEKGKAWCDVATVLEVVGSARGREFDTERVDSFTAQCVKAAGGWFHLRNLSAQQISIELHNARKMVAS
jgi:DNA-binding transcriptional ArsR family regulator